MKNHIWHKNLLMIGYGHLYSNHLRPVYLLIVKGGGVKPTLKLSFAVS